MHCDGRFSNAEYSYSTNADDENSQNKTTLLSRGLSRHVLSSEDDSDGESEVFELKEKSLSCPAAIEATRGRQPLHYDSASYRESQRLSQSSIHSRFVRADYSLQIEDTMPFTGGKDSMYYGINSSIPTSSQRPVSLDRSTSNRPKWAHQHPDEMSGGRRPLSLQLPARSHSLIGKMTEVSHSAAHFGSNYLYTVM
jgi:hypothetical protein